MTVHSQDGLAWDSGGWDLTPVWTREPSIDAIETICRQRLHIDDSSTCSIAFYAEGAFNKLYLVETGAQSSVHHQSLLMRVSLPVYPHYKTRGEVTTMRWVHEHTDIPVPRVIDFDDNSDNGLGFEWILMEMMPGLPAWRRWRRMTMAQKVFLTQRISEWQAQLFRHGFPASCFRGVGTLDARAGSEPSAPMPGQIVSIEFFMGEHIKYNVARGPFRSSHDWLKSCLEIISLEQEETMTTAEDKDDKERAEVILRVAKRLLGLLPRIFPSIQQPQERTALWHEDLGLQNILVDGQGNITAVIDWECVSAMPLWKMTCMPKFLAGPERDEEPKRHDYPDIDEAPPESNEIANSSKLDNEGKNTLYWVHLMEYEQTQLRKIYNDKMRSMWPEWDLQVEESKLKNDFCNALSYCGSGFSIKRILRWVDQLEAGECAALDLE